MNEDYRPVACALHSEYELLAMHRTPVRLHVIDDRGAKNIAAGIVQDLLTRQGGEYLVLLDTENNSHEFRLDRIVSVEK